MADEILPRRSVLYMPGANERALEKARTLPADSLILTETLGNEPSAVTREATLRYLLSR